ncbi:ABC transporter substrate-binding protein [Limobrevibacterium gyesilva]|uniref:ABC transporter substrate-binding protein n=1 Tax=Limobrevibacterium gyesilva TaxID=2991712 RepID=A0AA42CDV7_9PROT|nr:ABC transporter substrate-binding protein [Limobrevibacterium gyesilva]MCW3475338.1 ABC transporter substrate-binding protein [Limobrevibacterium gyesilva]
MSNRVIIASCALVLAAVVGGVAGPAQAKTFVYCSEGSPENFNPMLNTTGTTFDANRPVYDRLVDFGYGTTEVVPALAEKWDASEDGLVFTFHLRHNVKWQSNKNFKPTRNFNADDVLFSFERQWKDSNPYHKVSGGGYDYFSDMDMPKLLKSIDKIDDYTVRFVLTQPNAPFVADLAMDFATIQSKEYADALTKMGKPELIDQEPIGTGPFEFVQYVKDATIRYRAFKDYWGTKPKIDTLVYSINKDPSVRLAKLRANECQMSFGPSPADLLSIRADKNLTLMSQPGLNIGYLAMNVQKKPFDDVRVRQAINMAIDKKAILDAVYQGSGLPAKNLIPPTMWSYNNNVQDYKFDPAAAKKLLAEAGYPDGFETDLWAMPVQRPYNPDARRIGELMQADLAKVGVKAKIVSFEWGEYRKRVQAGEHMMAQLGWTGDNGDPDNFFVPLAACSAKGSAPHWCNKEYDDLVVQAAKVPSQAERTKLYMQAQVVMHREAPFFLIAHSVVHLPMRSNVVGYKMSPFGTHRFDYVDLK